jgi:hypothetical protein
VRSMEEVNQGLRGIVSEMTEYSKRSIGQALEIQVQLARMAFGPYDALIARAEALKYASFADGMAVTTKSQRPRAVAHSASVATKRKSGVVKRRTQSKKAKSKRSSFYRSLCAWSFSRSHH